jgi:uncharacterized protein YodC (DUF2158 family)
VIVSDDAPHGTKSIRWFGRLTATRT